MDNLSSNASFLKTYQLDSHKFDFILDSVGSLYSNPEITKILTDSLDDPNSDLEIAKCGFKVLDHLIYVNKSRSDGFVGFFLSSMRSFHKTNKCSTKTAICFTILLWKRICSIQPPLETTEVTRFSKYLREILDQAINILVNNSNLTVKTETKLFNKEFLNGLFRGDEPVVEILHRLVRNYGVDLDKNFKRENIFVNIAERSRVTSKDTNSENRSFEFEIKNGIVVPLDDQNFIKTDQTKTYRSIMLDSSLQYEFVHLGFNKKIELEKYKSSERDSNSAENWKTHVKAILTEYQIRALFIRGGIEPDLRRYCESQKILVVSKMSPNVFCAIKEKLCLKPIVYMEDFKIENVVEIKLGFIESQILRNSYVHLADSASSSSIITVIIESKYHVMNSVMKESLEHNLKRLEHLLKEGCYLKGGSHVEMHLSEQISTITSPSVSADDDNFWIFCLAKEILAATFKDLRSLVRYEASDLVYDDLSSKIEAWKLAVFINTVFIDSDFSVCY